MSFLWQCPHTLQKGTNAFLAGTPAKEPLLERAHRAFPHSFFIFKTTQFEYYGLCLLSPLRFHGQHLGVLFVCKAVLSFSKELGCV